jgi:hypothetical protein
MAHFTKLIIGPLVKFLNIGRMGRYACLKPIFPVQRFFGSVFLLLLRLLVLIWM